MEEPNKGSTNTMESNETNENLDNLRSSFLINRGHYHHYSNSPLIIDDFNTTTADSGYSSLNNYSNNLTPNNTQNASLLSSTSSSLSTAPIVTTPQKPSSSTTTTTHHHHLSSNLLTIPEIPDSVKLTPVTQNIRIFSSIHITTPKSKDFQQNAIYETTNITSGVKRNALSELKFDDYQSTPKKKRFDCDLESIPRNILNTTTTPLRGSSRKSTTRSHRKLLYRHKLRSAPDLNFGSDDNAENFNIDGNVFLYGASQLTPLRSPLLLREKRTPLSSSSSNLIQASTPKSISKYDDGNSNLSPYYDKPASVRKLLSFSDKEFEALLSSSTTVPSEKLTKPVPPSVSAPFSAAIDDSVNTVDIYQEDSFREYKKNQPIISSYKTIIPPYVPETKAATRSFKRTLKFAYQSTPSDDGTENESQTPLSKPSKESSESEKAESGEDNLESFHDDSLKDYKTLYQVIDDVIRNRRILKRQRSSTTARLVDIRRESHSITRSNRNKKFHSASETVTQQQQQQLQNKHEEKNKEQKKGFQQILGYVPSSYDLKISEKNTSEISGDNVNGVTKRKLSLGESDMDISPPLVKSPNTTTTTPISITVLDNYDLDISKESSKSVGSLMSIEKTPEPLQKKSLTNKVEDNIIKVGESISNLQNDNISIDIPDESWLANIDFEAGILTPPRRCSLTPEDTNGNILKASFCETTEKFLPSTPKKLKQRQNTRSSIDYERHEILYPSIPRTPKKSSSSHLHKHKSCNAVIPFSIPIKRKASISKDIDKRTKIFYDGLTHLNIIAKLESYDLVLDRIFEMLSSQDLMNLTLASKSLRNIVLNNLKAKQRILKYLSDHQKIKENDVLDDAVEKLIPFLSSSSSASLSQFSNRSSSKFHSMAKIKRASSLATATDGSNSSSINNRMPFKCSNTIFDRRRSSITIQKSPPVSPSKRKFYENQKVVKSLSGHEKLIKCPRCSRSSRIINKLPPLTSSKIDSNGNHQTDGLLSSNSMKINQHKAFHILSSNENTSTNLNHYYFSSSTGHNNNSDDEFISLPNSQPISSQRTSKIIKAKTTGTSTKSKFVKSMSVDSALYLPTTPKKNKIHHQPYSIVSSLIDDDNNDSSSYDFIKYGECTGIACKFRFCLDCLCEYHPNMPCKISLTVNNSPSKEDVQNGILQISNSSKTTVNASVTATTATSCANNNNGPSSSSSSRSLKTRRKSLKRLCF